MGEVVMRGHGKERDPKALSLFFQNEASTAAPELKTAMVVVAASQRYSRRRCQAVARSAAPQTISTNKTDVRQVGIAVSMSLFANLDDPDNWHQHADIPEPSSKDVRTLLS